MLQVQPVGVSSFLPFVVMTELFDDGATKFGE